MPESDRTTFDRRNFLKTTTAASIAALASNKSAQAKIERYPRHPKVVVLAFDGMDPRLTEKLLDQGRLPNLAKMRDNQGYQRLGTSIPPQTPVAFSTLIVGANPGEHGIFDFVHRDPAHQFSPQFSAAGTSRSVGGWEVGKHRLPLAFWPFGHQAPKPVLHRHGIPFWDLLDQAGIPTHVYEIPSNFPPSKPPVGLHRAVAGMGTPDLLGGYGTYQHFAEDGPPLGPKQEGGGVRNRVRFKKGDRAKAVLRGPDNTFLKRPQPIEINFDIHRDRRARAVVIDIQDQRLIVKEKQWSRWVPLGFQFTMPSFLPDETVSGICRFYLQEVEPNFRLYVTPINFDPTDPAVPLSEPEGFIREIADDLGYFYTAGFQEDHKALSNQVFTDEEYAEQTEIVLQERIELLNHALDHYRDGMLFFYFAGTDLQSHMFWWDTDDPHPLRKAEQAQRWHSHIEELYIKMDTVVGDVTKRLGDDTTIIAMSDHGFANFKRQFSLNQWLRDQGYIAPDHCTRLMDLPEGRADVDWTTTRVYGLGLNGLYLNLKGRERDGIVEQSQRDQLLDELIEKLLAVRDDQDQPVIARVYRGDEVYKGQNTTLAPDLVLGYHRGYRVSWASTIGDLETDQAILTDNNEAWCADHCMAAEDLPGVLFCNRPLTGEAPSLEDLAPSILNIYNVAPSPIMKGANVIT